MEENIKQQIAEIANELRDINGYVLSPQRHKQIEKLTKKLDTIVSRVELPVMQKARLYIKAKIQLLGMDKPKEVPITNISFKDEELFSVTVKYPLGNNHYDYLTYYFDGRKLGEEKDIDVSEIFKGFSA